LRNDAVVVDEINNHIPLAAIADEVAGQETHDPVVELENISDTVRRGIYLLTGRSASSMESSR
jgi:hypothetical protein